MFLWSMIDIFLRLTGELPFLLALEIFLPAPLFVIFCSSVLSYYALFVIAMLWGENIKAQLKLALEQLYQDWAWITVFVLFVAISYLISVSLLAVFLTSSIISAVDLSFYLTAACIVDSTIIIGILKGNEESSWFSWRKQTENLGVSLKKVFASDDYRLGAKFNFIALLIVSSLYAVGSFLFIQSAVISLMPVINPLIASGVLAPRLLLNDLLCSLSFFAALATDDQTALNSLLRSNSVVDPLRLFFLPNFTQLDSTTQAFEKQSSLVNKVIIITDYLVKLVCVSGFLSMLAIGPVAATAIAYVYNNLLTHMTVSKFSSSHLSDNNHDSLLLVPSKMVRLAYNSAVAVTLVTVATPVPALAAAAVGGIAALTGFFSSRIIRTSEINKESFTNSHN